MEELFKVVKSIDEFDKEMEGEGIKFGDVVAFVCICDKREVSTRLREDENWVDFRVNVEWMKRVNDFVVNVGFMAGFDVYKEIIEGKMKSDGVLVVGEVGVVVLKKDKVVKLAVVWEQLPVAYKQVFVDLVTQIVHERYKELVIEGLRETIQEGEEGSGK